MPYVTWRIDREWDVVHIGVSGVFDITLTDAEYQDEPGSTDEAAYVSLLRRKTMPYLFLSLPVHDRPLSEIS